MKPIFKAKSRIRKILGKPIGLMAMEALLLAATMDDKCIPYEGF
ncbi:hypothetical protein [Olivibacter jilunii]|nr:hypothetical protein [Olivibacter jilunii]